MGDDNEFRRPSPGEFDNANRRLNQIRYSRRNPRGGRVAALDKLHSILVNDAQLYETDKLQNQRDAVAHALLSVVHYLGAQGFSEGTLVHLMRPVVALAERENGSLDMLFSEPVKKKGGRPKATLTQHERTGILSALAEAWLMIYKDDERTQPEKLAACARKLKGRWFGKLTKVQLKTALDLVRQEASDHPAVATSRITLDGYRGAAEKFGPTVAFDILVRWLNETKLSYGAGEGGISKTPPVSPSKDD